MLNYFTLSKSKTMAVLKSFFAGELSWSKTISMSSFAMCSGKIIQKVTNIRLRIFIILYDEIHFYILVIREGK